MAAASSQARLAEPLPDLVAPGLRAIFCGLNPGHRAAASGHHFEGRQNRFWAALHRAGITPRQLEPREDRELLRHGYGLTTIVRRATRCAAELSAADYLAARPQLERRVAGLRPRWLAFLGKAGWAALSGQGRVEWGPQQDTFGGAGVWILPNPSGLNRGFDLDALAAAYRRLHLATQAD